MSWERDEFTEIRGDFGTGPTREVRVRQASSPNLKTQRGRILQRLLRGDEVAAPELARIGGLQFQTRIFELRHEFNFQIENRKEGGPDGQIKSYYRLVTRPSTVRTGPARIPESPQADTLFDLSVRHRDDG
jgi:hypothetical protein